MVEFTAPTGSGPDNRVHHAQAAAGNAAVAARASGLLLDALSGDVEIDRILLKAAAGAGKSYVLRKLVADAVQHRRCARVAVIAFQNRQIWPLAIAIGKECKDPKRVCLFISKDRFLDLPDEVHEHAVVVTSTPDIPADVEVVISTSHKLGAFSTLSRLLGHFGPASCGDAAFDVLFVDEAWQLPHHLFDRVAKAAPLTVGVGDVGQLPPLEVGQNPWRGDPGFNPYRAWPTDYGKDSRTVTLELPAVWRPPAGQIDLWRAFYPEWGELNCVAGPDDRRLAAPGLTGAAAAIWAQVGTGVPTLLEVEGLAEPEAADVDLPLMQYVESLLDELFAAGAALEAERYSDDGSLQGTTLRIQPGGDSADPLVAVLATRNQAVDDAADVVGRLRARHGLADTECVASTVDSWQGQTNGITVAVHPLSGAAALDKFNSAFGRLAVTCTRATHGLLMVTRPGLDQLLGEAPARPGTPFGEPGNRHLPRQTHQRILATFARGKVTVTPDRT